MQQSTKDQKFYHEEAGILSLKIILQDNKLTFTLKNYKEYTENDIGKEIHKKMDLFDVFSAFSQTKNQQDDKKYIKQSWGSELKKYQFGQIFYKNKLPCFQIEKEGKITCYLNMIDRKTNQQVMYQSNLTLTQVGKFSEKDISLIKPKLEKTHIDSEVQMYIREREQFLVKRITSLERANTKLAKDMNQIREELRLTKVQLFSKMQTRINQIRQKQNQENFQIQNLQNLSKQNRNFFKIKDTKVQYIGINKKWTHFIFDVSIHPKEWLKFKIKIIRTKFKNIMIGVVDYASQQTKRKSFNSGNALCYYGGNGIKYPEIVGENNGFSKGDVVQVRVDRVNSLIKYIVNGEKKASQFSHILADSSRVFMPYVEMYNTNDVVEWM